MIWFTADHHFGHDAIRGYANRPFATGEDMDKHLVMVWNMKVKDGDLVYHLGDFTLGHIHKFYRYVAQLNGIIKIVPGGHDYLWLEDHHEHGYALPQHVEVLPPLVTMPLTRGTNLTLCHYPLRSWERSFHGAWHLHGHEHGRMPMYGRSMDVGVDTHGSYAPYSYDEIAEKLSKREIVGSENLS